MATTSTDTSGREPDDRPLRRRGVQRLAYEQWGTGGSVWEAEIAGRELAVDRLDVREGDSLGDGGSDPRPGRRARLDEEPPVRA